MLLQLKMFPPCRIIQGIDFSTKKNIAKEHLRGVCQHNALGHPATDSQEFKAKEILRSKSC